MAAPASAPTVTQLLWSTQPLGELVGTAEKFTILARWSQVATADGYEVELDQGTGSTGTIGGTYTVADAGAGVEHVWYQTYDGTLGTGATLTVRAYNGDGDGPDTVISLTPTSISGGTEISANVNGRIWHPLSLGPTRPTDWEWTLAGAPSGVTISAHEGADDGGVILGASPSEGIYNLTVGLTNYGASSNILYAQNYPVTLHVSGERYIEDFHEDTSRTGINIRHPKGTPASWNTNTAGELEVILGDAFTLHAILRNGTGYLSSGVTDLRFTAKIPGCPDGPAILSASAASPTVGTFGTVSGWPLSLTVDSTAARALFTAANTPVGASTDAGSVLLTANISYVYGGRTYRSDAFAVRLKQPVSLF